MMSKGLHTAAKRRLALVSLLSAALLLSACHRVVPEAPESISVYATFYPIYALTDAVMGDVPNASLHCLVQPQDGCLRNYQLSDWDIYLIAGADAVIAGGRGLESFEGLLFSIGDDGPAVSAVLYNLELYNQARTHAQYETDSHLDGANPHLYMSMNGAQEIIDSLSAQLVSMDPVYAQQYVDNAQKVKNRLESLLEEARGIASGLDGKSAILMNEALIYVAQDYGLDVACWYDRESGTGLYDTELERCLAQLAECGAKVVLIERQAPQQLVDALTEAGYRVARIDILSTHDEPDGFETYINAQLSNARALRDAFEGM